MTDTQMEADPPVAAGVPTPRWLLPEDVQALNDAAAALLRAGHEELSHKVAFVAFAYCGPGHRHT